MKRRFILALGPVTVQQNDAFRSFVVGAGLNWWHWIPNLWLLVDYQNQWNSTMVRDKAMQFFPGVTLFVDEIADSTWAAFGPGPGSDKDMFPWLSENWRKWP